MTVTLIYCYIVNFLTAGGQTVAIIVTEQTFEDAFDRMGIHRRVLSRTLEDAGTLSAPIVPWGVATLYVMEVLGCGTEYIPYCWFIFIVPIFSILCAFSGFGIWDKDGNKMWGRKKAAAKGLSLPDNTGRPDFRAGPFRAAHHACCKERPPAV